MIAPSEVVWLSRSGPVSTSPAPAAEVTMPRVSPAAISAPWTPFMLGSVADP